MLAKLGTRFLMLVSSMLSTSFHADAGPAGSTCPYLFAARSTALAIEL